MRKKFFLNDNDIKWFKDNYPIMGANKCCEILNFPKYAISSMANKLRIKVIEDVKFNIRSRNSKKRFSKQRDNYKELSKKIIIDSPEKAYSLGFLWGDGHLKECRLVYYPSFGIVKEDFDNIIDIFKCWGKWKIFYCRKKSEWKEIGEAILHDPILGMFLKDNQYLEKSKVKSDSILYHVPENLRYMWFRGYIDADGCFYCSNNRNICQFSICGSYDQDWSSVEDIMKKLDITYYIHKRKNKCGSSSSICIYRKNDIVKMGKYIYQGKIDIGLSRKHTKYLQIMESIKYQK